MIKYIPTSNRPLRFQPTETEVPFIGYTPQYTYTPQPQKQDEETSVVSKPSIVEEQPAVAKVEESKTDTVEKAPEEEIEVIVPTSEYKEAETITTKKNKRYSDKREFVKDLTSAYEKELATRGLDKKYAKYLVAQDALESGWGKSSLSEYFNFGGIKATKGSPYVEKKTYEYDKNKNKYEIVAKFRKFKDLAEYVNYKISLLGNSRYNAFADSNDDARAFFSRIKNGGYATSPNYVEYLLGVINNPLFAKSGIKLPNFKQNDKPTIYR